jgi:predicted HTH transcriptional regulator
MQGDDEKYIRNLIAEGEHQQQDFKFEITSSRKIAKTLVAFANTDGGRLLIGVKDNGRISGIRTDEEYFMIEAAASLFSKPEIPFESYHRTVEGKTILEITISPSDQKPHYARNEENHWLAYHRVKDNNFLADYILLQVWKRKKRSRGTFIAYSENEQKVMEILSTDSAIGLDEIRDQTKFRKKKLQQILVNLVSLQAVQMSFLEDNPLFSLVEE